MKTTISLMLWLMIPTVLIGAPIAAIVLGTDRQAMIPQNDQLSSRALEQSTSLLMRYDPTRMTKGEITTIVAREDELNAALSAGLADRRTIRGRVAIEASRVRIDATAELPDAGALFGRYVNITANIAPSRLGLDITGFRIGKIDLPKPLAAPAMQILLGALLGPGKGAQIIENIHSVDISGKTVAIGYRPTGKRSARLARLESRRDPKPINVKLQSTPGEAKLGYNQNEFDNEGSRN